MTLSIFKRTFIYKEKQYADCWIAEIEGGIKPGIMWSEQLAPRLAAKCTKRLHLEHQHASEAELFHNVAPPVLSPPGLHPASTRRRGGFICMLNPLLPPAPQPSEGILMRPFHPLPPSPTFSPPRNQQKDLQKDNVWGRLIPASLCVAYIIHSLEWSHMWSSCYRQSDRCQKGLAQVGSDYTACESVFYSLHRRGTLSPPKARSIMSLFGGTWPTGRVISSVEAESWTSLGLPVCVLFTKLWPV